MPDYFFLLDLCLVVLLSKESPQSEYVGEGGAMLGDMILGITITSVCSSSNPAALKYC